MGYRNRRRFGKFYSEQVTYIHKLLEKYVSSSAQIDIDKYLRICEQLGQEPDPSKMPLTSSDFPEEVQVAFFIFGLLSDRWDGASGTYLGKDWTIIFELFDLYDVTDRQTILYFMKLYEYVLVEYRAKEAENRRKASERRQAAGGGKSYTYNIQG